ncbi:FecR family protein [Pedobacter frigoris]|uniref:FecR family protein n=1 Tax=Pedobacter frigoris TaxID=2571272 RepID=UPI002931B240|nr:FecR family protein [Pedobacter frigoris]
MKESEFLMLADKVSAGSASKSEISLYNAYLNFLGKNTSADESGLSSEEVSVLWDKINMSIDRVPEVKSSRLFYKVAIAASLLLISGFGIYFFNSYKQTQVKVQMELASDIQPGSNKAILTLANGRKMVVDQNSRGKITSEKGVTIGLLKDGEVVYEATNTENEAFSAYNKMETNTGGQSRLILPDGTKVWLNSSSSLRYPVLFNSGERRVELTGEAYFEVAKDKSKVFKVITNMQEVQVLGTKFNVNAYPEEQNTKTTLLEGSVNVGLINKAPACLLKPGQQAIQIGQQFKVSTVDTEEFISWKDGYFLFNNEPISTAMRKLARWYDVEVVYEGDFADINFGGTVFKSNTLKKTLKLLESTNRLKFKVEGRRIRVMK